MFIAWRVGWGEGAVFSRRLGIRQFNIIYGTVFPIVGIHGSKNQGLEMPMALEFALVRIL